MNPDLTKIVSLLNDASRAAILDLLMDGKPHPASELALFAKIKPQTASFHLNKMLEIGIVSVERHGRHRYYKLTNNDVACLIESLYSVSPQSKPNSFNEARERKQIEYARTCYDHLAGFVGVQVTDALSKKGYIEKMELDFIVTQTGENFFENLDIDIDFHESKRRSFARCCLDWSERQHHLAGSLGNALLESMFDRNWIKRIPKTRAIEVTSTGKSELKELLSIEL
ncbi:helix-turn-helix transcriptional regulator [Alkalihalobacillus sp. AL-G]|uniref:ArsR/SmtB family transcription factor n=1 Tax=Alkalihalobacillus sp. AL-G TaxID=2926399 RepID=UPI00272B96AF|nr:winged helix-turn-helix domain-containing protein [Alkalihalobacillus sp. AL-G]WLD94699.1 winged helix-turn-helix domain-containing protein [Alkalihalobacillus sp. AL-G]